MTPQPQPGDRPLLPEDVHALFQAVPPPPGMDRWRTAPLPAADPLLATPEDHDWPLPAAPQGHDWRLPAAPDDHGAVPAGDPLRAAPGRRRWAVAPRTRWLVFAGGAVAVAAFLGAAPLAARVIGPERSTTVAAPPSVAAPATPASPSPRASSAVPPPSPAGNRATARPSPSASATGAGVPAGVTLRRHTGALSVTVAGTVVDAQLVTGAIVVDAPGVTIRRTRVVPSGSRPWAIRQTPQGSNLVVEDTEVAGGGHTHFGVGQEATGLTVRRCDLHDVDTGVSYGSNATVADNRIHDVQAGAGSSGGASTVSIIRNMITTTTASGEAAIAVYTQSGPQRSIVVAENVIAGGNYTLHVGEGSASLQITVRGNRFARTVFPDGGRYGPVAGWDDRATGNVWQDNVWADTGAPVRP